MARKADPVVSASGLAPGDIVRCERCHTEYGNDVDAGELGVVDRIARYEVGERTMFAMISWQGGAYCSDDDVEWTRARPSAIVARHVQLIERVRSLATAVESDLGRWRDTHKASKDLVEAARELAASAALLVRLCEFRSDALREAVRAFLGVPPDADRTGGER